MRFLLPQVRGMQFGPRLLIATQSDDRKGGKLHSPHLRKKKPHDIQRNVLQTTRPRGAGHAEACPDPLFCCTLNVPSVSHCQTACLSGISTARVVDEGRRHGARAHLCTVRAMPSAMDKRGPCRLASEKTTGVSGRCLAAQRRVVPAG